MKLLQYILRNNTKISVFVLVSLCAVVLLPLKSGFISIAKADIPAPPLYSCPPILSGWGQNIPLTAPNPTTLLPNGHQFCGYYILNGDTYAGAFDRVLGVPINFVTIDTVTAINSIYRNPSKFIEGVGWTGSKCLEFSWGEAIYYITNNCGAQHYGAVSIADMYSYGAQITPPGTIISGYYINPYCVAWLGGIGYCYIDDWFPYVDPGPENPR